MYNPLVDSRGRKRPVGRQPTGRSISTFERDLKMLQFVHLYGGMATSELLFQYCLEEKLYTKRHALHRRLRQMYDEGNLWIRHKKSKYEYTTHQVSNEGDRLLKQYGLYSEYAPKARGTFEHQKMLCSIYQSYYLSCRRLGIEFTPQHVLLEKVGHGERIEAMYNGKPTDLVPDALFKIKTDGKEALIFLEVDRGTEPGFSTDPNRKSWVKNAEQYRYIIGSKTYKEHFGVPPNCAAHVHVVTSSPSYMQRITNSIAHVFPEGCPFIYLNYCPSFGELFYTRTYFDMMKAEWYRHGKPEPFTYPIPTLK